MKNSLVVIIIAIGFMTISIVYTFQKAYKNIENFSNSSLNRMRYKTEKENNFLLLGDSFPITNNPNKLTNAQYSTTWKQYPTLNVSSLKQITNNIRYNKSPENGSTTPSDFSGAFYTPIKNKSNYIHTLPPTSIYNARRVNYFLSH